MKRIQKRSTHRMTRTAGVVLFSVLCLSLFILLSGGSHVSAEQEAKEAYYTAVTVQPGDTLWSIAEEYAPEYADLSDYVRTLKEINHIRQDRLLQSGQTLVVVYYR